MYENLEVGTNEARTFTVQTDQTIDFMGKNARVYATPSLVRDIEHTCRDLIHSRVPEGEDSVGTVVNIVHMAPTLLGMQVTVDVTIAEIDGRKVVFDVVAKDPLDTICKGRHERFIVDVAKTKERLKAKAAKVSGM
ncbi:MAG: thioesterase family protein [Rhodobacteraceae bacterium]|nr:thioesterase family protein [Paracoccaceae bacterium]